jgi:hypothetical protein
MSSWSAWGDTTRKADRNMIKKTEGVGRSMVKWGLITGALIALFTPTAEASTPHPARTVHVVSQSGPQALMRAAVRRCAVAPKSARQACWSLYTRPAFGDVPLGKDIVAECIHNARVEANDWPGKGVFATYLKGCVRGNIETP